MGCDGSRHWCCIHEIGLRFAESCWSNFGYKHTSLPPKENVERQESASPTANRTIHQKEKWSYPVLFYRHFQYISPVYCTSCTLPFRSSHVLLSCLEGSCKQIRYGWRENNKWDGIQSRERGSSPSSISMSYLTLLHLPWFCFLLNVSSSPAAAAF